MVYKREKGEYKYGGEMCGTVTPPSADCESSIFMVEISTVKRGSLLAPRLAACNIVGHMPVVGHNTPSWRTT